MDDIIEVLVKAGYFRARINNLADFDKIIGGFAWAMQAFSADLDIDIFYADSLDLGQKIALTERLVMVLVAMKCPHRIEPHQIVGLDYSSLLPVVKWLVKQSAEIRQEHELFNRLLALRYYFRVVNLDDSMTKYRHIVPASKVKGLHKLIGRQESDQLTDSQIKDKFHLSQQDPSLVTDTVLLARKLLGKELKDNKLITFSNLPLSLDPTAHPNDTSTSQTTYNEYDYDDDDGGSSTDTESRPDADDKNRNKIITNEEHDQTTDHAETSAELVALNKELDTELLATNQKILNLVKKLDKMPSSMEIVQYQRRYIELHQQLISKNKDVKKLYALYNSLDTNKYYLTKEINLLDSIADNLGLTIDSAANRDDFVMQLQEIISKIETVRDEVLTKLDLVKAKCDQLNAECAAIVDDE